VYNALIDTDSGRQPLRSIIDNDPHPQQAVRDFFSQQPKVVALARELTSNMTTYQNRSLRNTVNRENHVVFLDTKWGSRQAWLPDAFANLQGGQNFCQGMTAITKLALKHDISLSSLWQPDGLLHRHVYASHPPKLNVEVLRQVKSALRALTGPTPSLRRHMFTRRQQLTPTPNPRSSHVGSQESSFLTLDDPMGFDDDSFFEPPSDSPEQPRHLSQLLETGSVNRFDDSLVRLDGGGRTGGNSISRRSSAEPVSLRQSRQLPQLLDNSYVRREGVDRGGDDGLLHRSSAPPSLISPAKSRQLPRFLETEIVERSDVQILDARLKEDSPSSDSRIQRCVDELRGGARLTDDAMALVAQAFRQNQSASHGVKIVDPLWLEVDSGSLPQGRFPNKGPYQLIAVPLHHRTPGHWSLAVIDPGRRLIRYFDPLWDDGRFGKVTRILKQYLLQHLGQPEFSFDPVVGQQQADDSSCGVLVLAAIRALCVGKSFDNLGSPSILRSEFAAMLQPVTAGVEGQKRRRAGSVDDAAENKRVRLVENQASPASNSDSGLPTGLSGGDSDKSILTMFERAKECLGDFMTQLRGKRDQLQQLTIEKQQAAEKVVNLNEVASYYGRLLLVEKPMMGHASGSSNAMVTDSDPKNEVERLYRGVQTKRNAVVIDIEAAEDEESDLNDRLRGLTGNLATVEDQWRGLRALVSDMDQILTGP